MGDETTPAIRVSVVEEKRGLFRKRYRPIYSESYLRYDINSYRSTAKSVVENYKKELDKWE